MTRLKFTLLLCVGLGCLTTGLAQERSLYLKASGAYTFERRIFNPVTGQSLLNNTFSAPQMALLIPTRSGDFHEIGVQNLLFSHPQGRGGLRLGNQFFRIQSSYQYNLTTRDQWERLKLYLGLGLSFEGWFDQRNLGTPTVPTDLVRSYGLQLGLRLTPGLMYDFSDRFFGSLAVPTTWLPLQLSQQTRTLANGNQLFQRNRDLNWWPTSVPLEIGLGVKF